MDLIAYLVIVDGERPQKRLTNTTKNGRNSLHLPNERFEKCRNL